MCFEVGQKTIDNDQLATRLDKVFSHLERLWFDTFKTTKHLTVNKKANNDFKLAEVTDQSSQNEFQNIYYRNAMGKNCCILSGNFMI